MKHLVSVRFVFENVESFEIEAKYFGFFHVGKIGDTIRRIACNAIEKLTYAHEVALEIYSEANVTYFPFGDEEEATTKFGRIMEFDDITSIVLTYDDGSEDDMYTDYDQGDNDELGAPNLYQHVLLSDLGNLYIVIGKNMLLSDWFDDEEINNDELIHFHKRMQDVCEKNAKDIAAEEKYRMMLDGNDIIQ